MALRELAAQRPERGELLECLHTFGDGTQTERVRRRDDRAADRVTIAIASEIRDERLIDLDRVDRIVLQRHE